MEQKIINLTLLLVIQEIAEILTDYPENPYQFVFSPQRGLQKLINHVLNQIPNHYYTILDEKEELPTDLSSLYASLEERMQLEAIIRKSIFELLQEYLEEINGYVFEEADSLWLL
ncbi:MAG TPA: hypothetical protein DCL61_29245 [Cyanobacteria bacterium UBA12227]|nr:hypothetical protein [Cyanobacteria bacterium UBA12227]HAX85577.1 hypothetical protein [Cyanobacteria bacterium UBA11370]